MKRQDKYSDTYKKEYRTTVNKQAEEMLKGLKVLENEIFELIRNKRFERANKQLTELKTKTREYTEYTQKYKLILRKNG